MGFYCCIKRQTVCLTFKLTVSSILKIELTHNAESSYLAAWAPANKAWSHSQGNIAVMDSWVPHMDKMSRAQAPLV